jgi:hypothetical protein
MTNKILNRLILLISGALLISSCNNNDSINTNYQDKNNFVEEIQEDIYDPVLSEKWVKENTPHKDENFIRFNYTLGTKEDFDKFNDILLRPYEKNDTKIHHSKMKITENKDSVVITFWQQKILEGYYFTGNIEVKNDTLKLLFEKICSPYEEITAGEIVLMHHKYAIKPNALRKIIVIENRNIE